jgi:hypothetical protein
MTAALVLDGVRAMNTAQRDELRQPLGVSGRSSRTEPTYGDDRADLFGRVQSGD